MLNLLLIPAVKQIDLFYSYLGMGPMPWTVNSEIYPLWARSTGNACSSGVNWVFNVLVSLTFLHTAEYLTYYGKKQYVSVRAPLLLAPDFLDHSVGFAVKCQLAMQCSHHSLVKTRRLI